MVKSGHFSIFFVISFCWLYLNELNAQTVMTFKPSKDNSLIEKSDGSRSNGSGPLFFVGRVGTMSNAQPPIRRGLIAFDLTGSIPEGATITNVTLTLNMSRSQNSSNRNITLNRLSADWGEGASSSSTGQGAVSATDDATWLHRFFNTESWTTQGGDFSGTASATAAVGGTGSYTWGSTTEMVADVQDWLDSPANNFGWIILGDEETSQSVKGFSTKEGSTPTMLTVTFTPPTSVEDRDNAIPSQFSLKQNFPNPFNPSTVINYSIPQSLNSSQIKLEIFNLLGQNVITLVDAKQVAGEHSIQWDGKDEAGNLITSGVYLYRLKTESFVEMRKMMFIR